MYTEAAPDFAADQGMHYPAASNYGYYCTGYELPGEWENHQIVFSVDGSYVQYTVAQSEDSPYICHMPIYGYAQSPYNPYNPYIPGAAVVVDSTFGSQQYYSIPQQNVISPPTYAAYIIQPDISSSGATDAFLETRPTIAAKSNGRGSKHKNASTTAGFSRNASKHYTYQANSLGRSSDWLWANTGQSKQPGMHRNVSSTGVCSPSNHAFQRSAASVGTQPFDDVSGSILLSHGQLEMAPPLSHRFSNIGSNSYSSTVHKLRPKIFGGTGISGANGSAGSVSEQNRGPRTKRSIGQLIVKAYTSEAGETDAQGNIVINLDQYNKEDFKIDYTDAKFFVIKSYSEDDVHKSIKYGVWSSTLHGNRKLQSAYEDVQRIASEKSCKCPIFLFFSVNASGMFCGVAEMTGPVAFHKDMDFWQQDKWSGSFPVKWHVIKDVPNSYFRHIILQNNENKPVTHSRDTQEIVPRQGLEMLNMFKDHAEKTSLLDDFMSYENRQRMMQEEKAGLLNGALQGPMAVKDKKTAENKAVERPMDEDGRNSGESSLGMVSFNINPNEIGSKVPNSGGTELDAVTPVGDIVRVGSMPIKVKASLDSVLTVGTIPLDPRSLKR